MRLIAGVLAVAVSVAAPAVHAQVVTGTVVGPDQRPVAGAVVELLNAASSPVAHAVVASTGAFSLRAPAAGRYQVRARQVGWRPILSAPLDLRAGATETVLLAFAGSAMPLDTIRVTNRSVCGRADDSTAAVVIVLENARTALLGTDVTRARGMTFAALRFDQLLDPVRENVVQQRTRVQVDSAAQPWASSSIEALRRDGYVVAGSADSVIYRLPGLDMLASSAFVEDHCFQFSGKSDRQRLGVSFEPTPARRKLADIKGTIWLDRATASLTNLEFRFANLEGAQDDAKPGGKMSFTRLRDGSWAVSEWAVRMPIIERRLPKVIQGARIGSGVAENVVANISVSGGRISAVMVASDTLFARPGIAVAGVTVDSATNKAVAGARVELLGTSVRAESNQEGRFTLRDVLPGEYLIAVRTPSLDSVRTASTFPLSVLESAPSTQTLKVANAAGVIALICPLAKTAASDDRGVLVGVVQGASPEEAGGARITLEWPADPAVANGPTRWLTTHAGADGTFRACGIPMDRPITVRGWSARSATPPGTVRIATTTRFASVELTLETERAESGVFTGAVLSDSTQGGKPIADAEVMLPALNRTTRTNADGLFHIADLPPGVHRVVVRKVGFGPLDASLTFAPRELVERRIILGAVSVLATVDVRATRPDPGMRDFEEHRALGIGKFVTRADLDRQKTATMMDVFMTVNGIKFKSQRGRNFATAGRKVPIGRDHCYYFENSETSINCVNTSECFMQVYLDNQPLFLGRDGESVPDLTRYRSEDIESAEIYANFAETPAKYQGLGTLCGTIVMHRRRR